MQEHAKPRTGAIALWAAILAITVTGPAAAQLYPGDDVQVNPNAVPRVVLEPDGRHVRVLQPLRQPGADAPVHLHMPVPHRHVARRTAPSTSVATETTPAPAPSAESTASTPPPAAPKPAVTRKTAVASNPPAAATPSASATDFSYGWSEPAVPTAQSEAKKSAPKRAVPVRAAAAAPPKPQPPQPKQTETASTEPATSPVPSSDDAFSFETPEIPAATDAPPPPAPSPSTRMKAKAPQPQPVQQKPQAQFASTEPLETVHHEKIGKPEKKSDDRKGLAKQGEVLFAGGSSDPQAASYQQIKSLASDLNGALDSGSARVEVEAYGGTPGDKSSDARRLSLRRALTVRQLLIDNGVPSDRIDVRALGGAEQGTPDRVDVFVKA